MKSIDNKLFTLFLAINIFLLTGCPNKDKTAPYITILGDNPLTVILNEQFTDPGASAQDNVDKDVSSRIVMTHNVPLLTGIQNGSGPTKEKGIYTVTYSVSDDAGNTGTATRTVKVVNSAEKYMGDYEVTTVSSNPVIAPSYTIEYDISLESDKKFNWMFKLPKLCKISSLKANAYIGKDAEGDNIPTIPKGYEITIIQTEMKIAGASPGDTTWYRISNYKVGENFSKLDTVINKYTIRYIIERQYPYDPENPDQNMQNGIITETYIRSY